MIITECNIHMQYLSALLKMNIRHNNATMDIYRYNMSYDFILNYNMTTDYSKLAAWESFFTKKRTKMSLCGQKSCLQDRFMCM